MLKGNLSTRPFYNERLVGLVLAGLALVGLVLAAVNVTELLSLSQRRSELRAQVDRDRAEAGRIRREAEALSRSVNVQELRLLSASTREANQLIDERTFSWTAFFGHVEKTLPLDAYLMGVSPRIEKGLFKVRMLVVSRASTDVDTFIEALEGTGAFYDALQQVIQQNDDGTYSTELEASYLPATAKAPEAPKAATGKGRPRP